MLEITQNNFNKEVAESNDLVVVDFWAPWCGPCKMIAPIMEQLNNEYGDKVKFAKLNVDDNPALANHFKVTSIPTVMMFKGGKVVDTSIGFKPKQALEAIIKQNI
ncbi:thioredoxin [Oceanirhabdus sp. W0125-5]|uniref:thioredoxin n=1 Tax=Oceanirhabdus sp. W0125-5 TaxID=2999116 RepID=UPI0022F31685|nr:thioredoxin [Oceanirhabdus sp. W0125-5]WBW98048.1 thioredoxin [Oceanirhabdus sp. W0125-5]